VHKTAFAKDRQWREVFLASLPGGRNRLAGRAPVMLELASDQRDSAARATLWSLGVFFIPLALMLGFGWFTQDIDWVGVKPLRIQFLVIDAKNGKPIPSAEITVGSSPEDFCRCDVQGSITLFTNEKGEATHWCRKCQCGGTRKRGRTSHYMCVPSLHVTAKAPGYSETAPGIDLDSPRYERRLDQGAEYATLTVSLALSPSTAKKRSN
jgi:hypothetical protein